MAEHVQSQHTKLNLLQRQDPSDYDSGDEAPYGSFQNSETESGDPNDDDNGGVISHTFDDARSGHLDDD